MYKDGIMGVIIGDALGCPVQFKAREEVKKNPVKGMRGHGTFNMPEGTWTDDGSMTLATLDSIAERNGVDLDDIMQRFVRWNNKGDYTPFGFAFDQGITCTSAIQNYEQNGDVRTCGGTSERSNGNGALMRILPVCLYALRFGDTKAIEMVHRVAGLTHNHIRGLIGCGLYYFMVKAVINDSGSLKERLEKGLNRGFNFYYSSGEIGHYNRMSNLDILAEIEEDGIRSSGYVVDSLEAAVWGLITTESFEKALLKVVNLGDDSDTVGAICGGLAGLYYGYDNIPEDWLKVIKRREWIEGLCRKMD